VLWRDILQVFMTPERLDYRIMPPVGLAPRDVGSLACRPLRPGEPPWQAAGEGLGELVERRCNGSPRIDIYLSDRFVRYRVLAWQAGIASRAEWRAYAEHAFREVHGEAARGWQMLIDIVPPGRPSLACAVETGLIDALKQIAEKRAARLAGLRPNFVRLFNRHNFSSGRQEPLWFGVAEPGHLCLGVKRDRAWLALRNETAPDGWLAALPGMIRRMRASHDIAAVQGDLHLCLCGEVANGGVPAHIEGMAVHAAETGFQRRRMAAVAASGG